MYIQLNQVLALQQKSLIIAKCDGNNQNGSISISGVQGVKT